MAWKLSCRPMKSHLYLLEPTSRGLTNTNSPITRSLQGFQDPGEEQDKWRGPSWELNGSTGSWLVKGFISSTRARAPFCTDNNSKETATLGVHRRHQELEKQNYSSQRETTEFREI